MPGSYDPYAYTPEEETIWEHTQNFLLHLGKGFITGFTTLSLPGDEPEEGYELIANSIGHLLGFIGVIPGVGSVASLTAKAVGVAARGGASAARFARGLSKLTPSIKAAETPGQAAHAIRQGLGDVNAKKIFGAVQTASTGPKALLSANVRKQLQEIHLLGGKFVHGIKQVKARGPEFRSVPFYLADIAQAAAIRGLQRVNIFDGMMLSKVQRGTRAHDTLHQSFRMGTAFSISSWQDGTDAMMQSFAFGFVLGGYDKVIANSSAVKANLRHGGRQIVPRFRDLTNLFGGSPEQKSEAAKLAARALAGSLFNGGISTLQGQPTELQVYDYLLGAYFGGREISADQAQALRAIHGARRKVGGFWDIEKTPEWTGEINEQGRKIQPYNEVVKAELLRWRDQEIGKMGQVALQLSLAGRDIAEDFIDESLRNGKLTDRFSEHLLQAGLLSKQQVVKLRDEHFTEERLFEEILQAADSRNDGSRDKLEEYVRTGAIQPGNEQVQKIEKMLGEKVKAEWGSQVERYGFENLLTEPHSSLQDAQIDAMRRDLYDDFGQNNLNYDTAWNIADEIANLPKDHVLDPEVRFGIMDEMRQEAVSFRQKIRDWQTEHGAVLEGPVRNDLFTEALDNFVERLGITRETMGPRAEAMLKTYLRQYAYLEQIPQVIIRGEIGIEKYTEVTKFGEPKPLMEQVSRFGRNAIKIWQRIRGTNELPPIGVTGHGLLSGSSQKQGGSYDILPITEDTFQELDSERLSENQINRSLRDIRNAFIEDGKILYSMNNDKDYGLYVDNPWRSIEEARDYLIEELSRVVTYTEDDTPTIKSLSKEEAEPFIELYNRVRDHRDPRALNKELAGPGKKYEKVLVTGGRNYADKNVLYRELAKINPSVIVHGAARGADSLAGEYAREKGVQERAYPADWNTYGNRAGFLRNQQMLDTETPDLVIAFPGGKGTAGMVKIARTAGVDVIEVGKPGEPIPQEKDYGEQDLYSLAYQIAMDRESNGGMSFANLLTARKINPALMDNECSGKEQASADTDAKGLGDRRPGPLSYRLPG